MFAIAHDVIVKGYDIQECLNGLLEHFRNILSVQATGSTSLIESSANFLLKYEKEAVYFSQAEILRLMHIVTNTEQGLRFAAQPGVRLELALTQMASLDSIVGISEVIQSLRGESGFEPKPIITPEKKTPELINPPIVEQKPQEIIKEELPQIVEEAPNTQPLTSDILNRWEEFIESTSAIVRFALHTAEARIEGNVLYIHAGQNFTFEQLQSNIETLKKSLNAFYGIDISVQLRSGKDGSGEQEKKSYFDSIETVQGSSKSGGLDFISSAPSHMEQMELNKPKVQQRELSEVEQALISTFGARELPKR
jgi:DNA polymerase-3 subunit gamma/tau